MSLKWRLSSVDIAISQCGRYFIHRIEVFGDRIYEAFYRTTNKPLDLGGPYGTSARAREVCEAHALKQEQKT